MRTFILLVRVVTIIGPGSYSIPDAIGHKTIDSTKANSVAFSFSKETREEACKVTDFIKAMREKSLPRENPGPAQYRSESLKVKPKQPSAVIPQAKRFLCNGKFFHYKVSLYIY